MLAYFALFELSVFLMTQYRTIVDRALIIANTNTALTNVELLVKSVFHTISSIKDTLIAKGDISEATAKKDRTPHKIYAIKSIYKKIERN